MNFPPTFPLNSLLFPLPKNSFFLHLKNFSEAKFFPLLPPNFPSFCPFLNRLENGQFLWVHKSTGVEFPGYKIILYFIPYILIQLILSSSPEMGV